MAHFHSNHSRWNSDMLTPRIIALSLKKKKKRMSGNVLNIPLRNMK